MHKYLLPGYIGALFRVVLHPEREISGLAPEMAARFCGDRRLIGRDSISPADSLPHQTAIAVEASLLAKRPVLSPVIRATARHLFNDGFA